MAKLPEQTISPAHNDRGSLEFPLAGDHGVIMLSHARQILYINPVAKRLAQELQESESPVTSAQPLPRQLAGLCHTLQGQLAQHRDREEWKHVQVQQAITTSKHRLLLRASGLPGESASSGHRILIFLEVAVSDRARLTPMAPRSLHLSTRQQAIVDGLIRGLSNKLIAEELQVSEYTVKEYLRTIMLKMQVGTRGAVVARFLGSPSMGTVRERKRPSRAPLAVRVTT
jgi:DNA-binding CsgD family transcriptional regulator